MGACLGRYTVGRPEGVAEQEQGRRLRVARCVIHRQYKGDIIALFSREGLGHRRRGASRAGCFTRHIQSVEGSVDTKRLNEPFVFGAGSETEEDPMQSAAIASEGGLVVTVCGGCHTMLMVQEDGTSRDPTKQVNERVAEIEFLAIAVKTLLPTLEPLHWRCSSCRS